MYKEQSLLARKGSGRELRRRKGTALRAAEAEAEANSKLHTDKFVQLNLARSLTNNTKFYFSGDNSALGSIFSKVLGSN